MDGTAWWPGVMEEEKSSDAGKRTKSIHTGNGVQEPATAYENPHLAEPNRQEEKEQGTRGLPGSKLWMMASAEGDLKDTAYFAATSTFDGAVSAG